MESLADPVGLWRFEVKGGMERRAGAIGRPSVREEIDAVLRLQEVDPIELQEKPRGRAAAAVKCLAI